MSFTRAQYERAFSIALECYFRADTNSSLERMAALSMWEIEDVIGQQCDFPSSAREYYPRAEFERQGLLHPIILSHKITRTT